MKGVLVVFRKIEVDDEVYAALQREAVAFEETTPNDVLRRMLLAGTPRPSVGRPGDLMPLLAAGHLEAGDKLVHHQPRKRQTFTAEVTPDGYIQLHDGRRFAAPSPALKACVGSEINGWWQWRIERTGQRLKEFRDN